MGLVFDRNDIMFDDVSSFYLPLASGVAGGDIARLISSNEGPWDMRIEMMSWRQEWYLWALWSRRCVSVAVAVGRVVAIGEGALKRQALVMAGRIYWDSRLFKWQ